MVSMNMQTIGLGIDLIEYESFDGMQDDARFLKKVFTIEEVSYCRTKSDPLPYLAARFATKEAVIKALGQLDENIFYSQIEILKRENGSIKVILKEHPHFVVKVSLSHGKRSAIATALATRA